MNAVETAIGIGKTAVFTATPIIEAVRINFVSNESSNY